MDLVQTTGNRAPIHLLLDGTTFSLDPELPTAEVRKRQNTVQRARKVRRLWAHKPTDAPFCKDLQRSAQ